MTHDLTRNAAYHNYLITLRLRLFPPSPLYRLLPLTHYIQMFLSFSLRLAVCFFMVFLYTPWWSLCTASCCKRSTCFFTCSGSLYASLSVVGKLCSCSYTSSCFWLFTFLAISTLFFMIRLLIRLFRSKILCLSLLFYSFRILMHISNFMLFYIIMLVLFCFTFLALLFIHYLIPILAWLNVLIFFILFRRISNWIIVIFFIFSRFFIVATLSSHIHFLLW